MHPKEKCKILFINLGYNGDGIFSFPLIKSIKNKLPDSHITILGLNRAKDVYELCPYIDKIITYCANKNKFTFNLLKIIPNILFTRYDYIFVHLSNTYLNLFLFIKKFLNKSKIIGFNRSPYSKLFYSKTVNFPDNGIYEPEFIHSLIEVIFPDTKAEIPQIVIPLKYIEWAHRLIGNNNDKLMIIIHPGCSSTAQHKSWAKENWTELIKKLVISNKYKILLCGGPDDKNIIDGIRQTLNLKEYNSNFVDLYCQTPTISEFAALVSISDILVCIDSAPMHIGLGIDGIKIISIIGPTNEKVFSSPSNKNHIIVTKDLNCRPCLYVRNITVNQRRLPACNNLECLNVSPDKVIQEIEKITAEISTK